MYCEICGRESVGEGLPVRIEGTLMKVCKSCAPHGEQVFEKKKKPERTAQRVTRTRPRVTEKTLEIVDDYTKIIRQNREKVGLTQEQLGAKINEKGSVIARIESGHMRPDLRVTKKLERIFSITLLEELDERENL